MLGSSFNNIVKVYLLYHAKTKLQKIDTSHTDRTTTLFVAMSEDQKLKMLHFSRSVAWKHAQILPEDYMILGIIPPFIQQRVYQSRFHVVDYHMSFIVFSIQS